MIVFVPGFRLIVRRWAERQKTARPHVSKISGEGSGSAEDPMWMCQGSGSVAIALPRVVGQHGGRVIGVW